MQQEGEGRPAPIRDLLCEGSRSLPATRMEGGCDEGGRGPAGDESSCSSSAYRPMLK